MTSADFDRWQSRYGSTEGYLFGEEPNRYLRACSRVLPATGRALCVADGDGRNGVWLARQGLEVVSLDFSPVAQDKARKLADRHGVDVTFVTADVHSWDYPADAFDVVVEIFAQFSPPGQRAIKWLRMTHALRPGGLMIVQGYTLRQLDFGTGGPKQPDQLYDADLLRAGFAGLEIEELIEEEIEMHEGVGHDGMSAVIGMIARKP